MEDGYPPLLIVAAVVLYFAIAMIHGFERALQNTNESQLERQAEEKDIRAERLLYIASKQDYFICVRVILMFLAGLLAGGMVYFLHSISIGIRIVIVVLYFIGLQILSVMVPAKTAKRWESFWLYKGLPVVSTMLKIFAPVTILVSFLSDILVWLLGIDPHASDDNVTEEEIMSMVNEGHEQGVLEASEAEMITNIFEFGDKEAGDIMTHRKNICALDANMSLEEATQVVLSQSNSRFPVYEEEIDNILGILYMKDALLYMETGTDRNLKLKEIPGLVRKAYFVPETRKIDDLFRELQGRKIHMVMVFDEYGQVAGLVTMEDILEEIVGNILDEYDEEEEYIVKEREGAYLIEGMAPLEEVGDLLGIEWDDEEVETLNGFLISKLGHIPVDDELPEVFYGGYIFEVCKVENKMIQSVRVRRQILEITCE